VNRRTADRFFRLARHLYRRCRREKKDVCVFDLAIMSSATADEALEKLKDVFNEIVSSPDEDRIWKLRHLAPWWVSFSYDPGTVIKIDMGDLFRKWCRFLERQRNHEKPAVRMLAEYLMQRVSSFVSMFYCDKPEVFARCLRECYPLFVRTLKEAYGLPPRSRHKETIYAMITTFLEHREELETATARLLPDRPAGDADTAAGNRLFTDYATILYPLIRAGSAEDLYRFVHVSWKGFGSTPFSRILATRKLDRSLLRKILALNKACVRCLEQGITRFPNDELDQVKEIIFNLKLEVMDIERRIGGPPRPAGEPDAVIDLTPVTRAPVADWEHRILCRDGTIWVPFNARMKDFSSRERLVGLIGINAADGTLKKWWRMKPTGRWFRLSDFCVTKDRVYLACSIPVIYSFSKNRENGEVSPSDPGVDTITLPEIDRSSPLWLSVTCAGKTLFIGCGRDNTARAFMAYDLQARKTTVLAHSRDDQYKEMLYSTWSGPTHLIYNPYDRHVYFNCSRMWRYDPAGRQFEEILRGDYPSFFESVLQDGDTVWFMGSSAALKFDMKSGTMERMFEFGARRTGISGRWGRQVEYPRFRLKYGGAASGASTGHYVIGVSRSAAWLIHRNTLLRYPLNGDSPEPEIVCPIRWDVKKDPVVLFAVKNRLYLLGPRAVEVRIIKERWKPPHDVF